MARASPKRLLKRFVEWTLRGLGPVSGCPVVTCANWECDRETSWWIPPSASLMLLVSLKCYPQTTKLGDFFCGFMYPL